MPKLIITRGVSGSGKSTWARSQNAPVVSRDDIRFMQFGSDDKDYYTADKAVLFERENLVTVIQDAMITALLKNGKDVIVDNTNIEWRYVKALAKVARKVGAEVEIKTFDVPLHVAQQRAAMRAALGGREVSSDIIRKQHDRLQGTKNLTLEPAFVPEPYTGTPGKSPAFLVDIDGTLAHMRDYRGPFDWKKVGLDDVDEVISDIVFRLGTNYGTQDDRLRVVVMSGRDQSCQDETLTWLEDHAIPWDHLYMRPEKDMRPDNIVKAELFDKYVRHTFDVKFVLDDRQQVVDMWRQMGLTCLQVAPGDF